MPNGKSGSLSTAQLTSSTSAQLLVADNRQRINLIIANHDTGTINMFVGGASTLTATSGLVIKSGTTLQLDSYTGPVYLLAASGTPVASYAEY